MGLQFFNDLTTVFMLGMLPGLGLFGRLLLWFLMRYVVAFGATLGE